MANRFVIENFRNKIFKDTFSLLLFLFFSFLEMMLNVQDKTANMFRFAMDKASRRKERRRNEKKIDDKFRYEPHEHVVRELLVVNYDGISLVQHRFCHGHVSLYPR